ncbi:MAG: hypothetical protein MEQ07_10740 [Aquimonas sp.]|nr:hypothetical protein [Aquimonas sp.]
MANFDFAQRLQAHAALLLDRQQSPGALRTCCAQLFDDCEALGGSLDDHASDLDCGRALSPLEAARCVLDFQRTTTLLRAVDAGLRTCMQQADTVEVLYAGCGPFAPLLLPLLARYPASRLQATLLDVHATALARAQALCSVAGVRDRLRPSLCADAARVQLPQALRPRLLIVEVMQRALEKEPQVAVLANLLPQCAAGALVVPQRIRVSAELADTAREFDPARHRLRVPLGELMELSAASLATLGTQLGAGRIACPSLRVPIDAPEGLDLILRTRIEASPEDVLDDYDSGLTYPAVLKNLGRIRPGELFHCHYRLGPRPGFELQRAGPM